MPDSKSKSILPPCGATQHVEIARGTLPISDWTVLRQSETVAVRNPDGSMAKVSVDVVGSEGDIAWVWLDHGGGRILLHKDEGSKFYSLTTD